MVVNLFLLFATLKDFLGRHKLSSVDSIQSEILDFPSQRYRDTRLLEAKAESWSCIADIDDNVDEVQVRMVKSGETILLNNMEYNQSSPREWMESIESETGVYGAYTVFRCDLKFRKDTCVVDSHQVWGEDFHLDRITTSYMAIRSSAENSIMRSAVAEAMIQSKLIIESIIDAAKQSSSINLLGSTINEKELCKVLMITLLWQPIKGDPGSILVKGHAFSTNVPLIPLQYDPHPMVAAVAIPWHGSTQLPARYNQTPLSKVSSWCRERRPLEEMYKNNKIGEVLLAKPSHVNGNEGFELLEGLTSNLFVVYKDGFIRTAGGDVLFGYARHLVLKAVEHSGLRICDKPISLEDAKRGLWAEAFVTSSIRLVAPIGKILIPNQEDHSFEELWSEESLSNLRWEVRRWRVLYEEILGQI